MKVTDSPDGVARLVGEVPGAPQEVFSWFTDADLLTRWWPERARLDARTDGDFELAWPSQDMRLLGRFLVFEPGARLVFTWSFAHEALDPRTVDIQFAAVDGRTRLTIDHTHGDDTDERQGYIDGWQFFIERLRDSLSGS
ncbi:MAG: SRPBCC domain-containing protein [Acidimicrobiia bacterium]|nr:SRPBCC domain-containing protein [Acidimicrobiia bacterium]MBT8216185.1 SRPBCC domain-containing protein [Acidimicrobiia bacterium]NNF09585.1 SRPBCC domain-containing protein [Acidimicrobiia bacterium]NNL69586.1 SRPBCC domain-containing protein [Acidimicrobiia bacterium]